MVVIASLTYDGLGGRGCRRPAQEQPAVAVDGRGGGGVTGAAVRGAPGDRDVVQVAVGGATEPGGGGDVGLVGEREGGGGDGGVADGAVTLLPADAHLVLHARRVFGGGGAVHVAVGAPRAGGPSEVHGAAVRSGGPGVAVDLLDQDVPLGGGGAGCEADGDCGAGRVGGGAEVDVHVVACGGATDRGVGGGGGGCRVVGGGGDCQTVGADPRGRRLAQDEALVVQPQLTDAGGSLGDLEGAGLGRGGGGVGGGVAGVPQVSVVGGDGGGGALLGVD